MLLKILKTDLKKGEVKLIPENLDDLWHLYNIIARDDEIYAKTTREVKPEGTGLRPAKGRRIPVFLGIRVKDVTFDRQIDRLRVKGIITEIPEEMSAKGAHHTINITTGKPLSIIKKEWFEYQLKRLKKACEYPAAPIVVVAIDYGECCIAILRHYGFDVKTEIEVKLPGKLEAEKRTEALANFFRSAATSLLAAQNETNGSIAIVGPGHIKNEFVKYLGEHFSKLAQHVVSVGSVSSGGVAGIYESLRCGILSHVAEHIRANEETRFIEEVFARLGAGGAVAFGLNNVEKAVEYGAVELLLVVDRLLREAQDEERRKLEDLMRVTEKRRGRVIIVSMEHEAGEKLWSIGGIAALLRFPINAS